MYKMATARAPPKWMPSQRRNLRRSRGKRPDSQRMSGVRRAHKYHSSKDRRRARLKWIGLSQAICETYISAPEKTASNVHNPATMTNLRQRFALKGEGFGST